MMKSTDTLMNAGDLAAPPGSKEWAIAVRLEIQLALKDTTRRAEDLEIWVRGMESNRGYVQLPGPDGKPFSSFEQFCCATPPWGIGYDRKLIEQIIKERRDAQSMALNAKDRPAYISHDSNSSSPGRTIRATGQGGAYLTDRIMRNHPEIFKQMKAGKFKSVKAAARAAGIKVDQTPLQLLQSAWRKANHEERGEFLSWLQEGNEGAMYLVKAYFPLGDPQ